MGNTHDKSVCTNCGQLNSNNHIFSYEDLDDKIYFCSEQCQCQYQYYGITSDDSDSFDDIDFC